MGEGWDLNILKIGKVLRVVLSGSYTQLLKGLDRGF